MNSRIEENFICKYINKAYRERILFELKSENKRLAAIMRFSHDIDTLIKNDCIYTKLKKNDKDELKNFLIEDNYYILSFMYLDGNIMNSNDVLDYIYNEYSPVIVCGRKNGIIKKEFEKGTYNYYLLKD